MSANILSLSNVLTVSASAVGTGVGAYNTSNLALFTRDVAAGSFGSLGYKIYLDAQDVGVDFGTTSYTYQMALQVFSQTPNILAGGGSLIIIPLLAGTIAVEDIGFSGTAASGAFTIHVDGNFGGTTASIAWNDTAATIQTKLQAIESMRSTVVTGSIASGLVFTLNSVNGVTPTFTFPTNTLMTVAPAAITITPTTGVAGIAGETIVAALSRTKGLVLYFGFMVAEYVTQADMLAAAAVVQANTSQACLFGVASPFAADVNSGGYLALVQSGGFTQTREFLYVGTGTLLAALGFMASYMSLGMSVNFSGSNTTTTMHLKNLNGVQPDVGMTQTILSVAQTAGADVYASFAGVAKVFTSGTNGFWDAVYNLQWFLGALTVAAFNYLAQSSTKIPQTEQGMTGFKAAQRQVCQQAVTNQYLAPGTWTSSTTFGNQADFLANIGQVGYYIYSAPISQQSAADRAARKAPLCQIAAKSAGAIQSASIIVFVTA